MIMLIFALFFSSPSLAIDLEFYLDTPGIIRMWGYEVDIYHVTTDDGYILELHRIPSGRMAQDGSRFGEHRPVMFLQHALLSSSFDWVCNKPEQSAGFVFADAGFDVWMGNFRGNTYSRRHVEMDPDVNKTFWDWSIDEHSKYDLPAMIHYVLNETNQPSVYYVGHSMGTLTMFTHLSVSPHFSKHIKRLFALAPVASIHNIRGAFSYISRYFGQDIQDFNAKNGPAEILQSSKWFKLFVKYTCALYKPIEELCSDIVTCVVGPVDATWNQTRVPLYISHTPAGTSTNVIAHFNQMAAYGNVPAYDMGPERNLEVYGSKLPPLYDYRKIQNVPIYLYWSSDDWLVTKKDVQEFLEPHLDASVLQGSYEISNYNHLHFVWGTQAAQDIYHPIINIVLREDFAE